MTHVTVREVMTDPVAAVRTSTPYKEIVRVLVEWEVGALPVLDADGELAGVVSEADLLAKEEYSSGTAPLLLLRRRHRAGRSKAAGDTAGELMTSPAITVSPGAPVAEAAKLLARSGVRQLPVTDADGHLVGIVSRRDLLKVFPRSDDSIHQEVVREVFARALWTDPTRVQVTVRDGVVILDGEVEQRSSIPVAVRLTRAVDGVVDVVDQLTYVVDDSDRSPVLRPII